MRSFQTQAFVLRSAELGESDRILRLLTPERARVSAVAKGARRSVRRFLGTLDLFNHLRVQLEPRPHSSLMRLEQARLIHPFFSLRAEMGRFALASYLFELIDRLAPEGGDPRDARRLFEFTQNMLGLLERSLPDARLRIFVELRTLAELGLRPEFSRCVRCGGALARSGLVGFHVREGGPCCARCGQGAPDLLTLHLGTLRALDQGLRLPLERIERLVLGAQALSEAARLASLFQRFHLGFEPRSEAFLRRTLGAPAAPAHGGDS